VLVRDVVARLEASEIDPRLDVAIAECNTALEVCLELQREVADHEDREDGMARAKDDLERLGRLLVSVDRADAAFIMRQIRRVLGRFDLRGA
jgi:hypothetical protein